MRGSWWVGAADLLLGATCPGCDAPGWGVCPTCHRSSTRAAYLTRPEPCPAGFPVTATAGPYDELMRRLISAHKERQVLALTPFLAERLMLAVVHLLGEAGAAADAGPVLVVPVPSTPAAVRQRGFDATWAMARRVARAPAPGGVMRAGRLLVQSRRVRDQAGLGAAARMENLAGSLRVPEARAARGGRVVVVDDVVTTGASLAEATRALRAAGVQVLGAATVAATVRSRSTRGSHEGGNT